uniref:Uncharacterized protein n=1 Tax=Oryza sativa subsp. japonica TaxID=39947 RepID=Q6K3B4_ORYSJ|nr:hypothetical protein [Oryza sativa Japonica Group]BAD19987.1 hypothetical protein [Oryza sativa Japonica Group]
MEKRMLSRQQRRRPLYCLTTSMFAVISCRGRPCSTLAGLLLMRPPPTSFSRRPLLTSSSHCRPRPHAALDVLRRPWTCITHVPPPVASHVVDRGHCRQFSDQIWQETPDLVTPPLRLHGGHPQAPTRVPLGGEERHGFLVACLGGNEVEVGGDDGQIVVHGKKIENEGHLYPFGHRLPLISDIPDPPKPTVTMAIEGGLAITLDHIICDGRKPSPLTDMALVRD